MPPTATNLKPIYFTVDTYSDGITPHSCVATMVSWVSMSVWKTALGLPIVPVG